MANLLGNVFAGAAQGWAAGNYAQVREEADEKRKMSYMRIAQQFQQDNARLSDSLARDRDAINRKNALEDDVTKRERDNADALLERDRKVAGLGLIADEQLKIDAKKRQTEYDTRVKNYGKEAADQWLREQDLGKDPSAAAKEETMAKIAGVEAGAEYLAKKYGEAVGERYRQKALGGEKSEMSPKERAEMYDKAVKQSLEMNQGMGQQADMGKVLSDADAIFARMTGDKAPAKPLAQERVMQIAQDIVALPEEERSLALQEIESEAGKENAMAVQRAIGVVAAAAESRAKRDADRKIAEKNSVSAPPEAPPIIPQGLLNGFAYNKFSK